MNFKLEVIVLPVADVDRAGTGSRPDKLRVVRVVQ